MNPTEIEEKLRKRRKGVNLGPCERNQTAVRNLLSDYLLIDPRDLVPTKF
jgi:hypothetical protein